MVVVGRKVHTVRIVRKVRTSSVLGGCVYLSLPRCALGTTYLTNRPKRRNPTIAPSPYDAYEPFVFALFRSRLRPMGAEFVGARSM